MKKLFLVLSILSLAINGYSQNNYIKKGSIGEVNASKQEKTTKLSNKFSNDFLYHSIEQTIGMTYMLLPSSYEKYIGICESKKQWCDDYIDVKKWSGEFLVLEKLEDIRAYYKSSTGVGLTGIIGDDKILNNVVLVADIDTARKLYLNKTYWLKSYKILTYDNKTGLNGKIENLKFEPVTIIDIVAAEEAGHPLRFILKTINGKIGYLDATISRTNSPEYYYTNYGLDALFYKADPKITYKMTPKMWLQVKNNKIVLGITPTQLTLMEGEPNEINTVKLNGRTYKDYIYNKHGYHSYLFLNGRLTMIH